MVRGVHKVGHKWCGAQGDGDTSRLGHKRDWDIKGVGHKGMETQVDWDINGVGHKGMGTRVDWGTRGLGHKGCGA